MPGHRRFELEELTNRPGTYFNPQTEVLIVVDDSPEVDQELFDGEERESESWVLIADAVPIDESARDELIERFQFAAEHGKVRGDDQLDEDIDEDIDAEPLIEGELEEEE
ncbi:MAG: hypothetical protein KGJ43_08885 [Acidobacteriota bacterium]|nr:hypothetical protein [Acidobacteriota bacterium]